MRGTYGMRRVGRRSTPNGMKSKRDNERNGGWRECWAARSPEQRSPARLALVARAAFDDIERFDWAERTGRDRAG